MQLIEKKRLRPNNVTICVKTIHKQKMEDLQTKQLKKSETKQKQTKKNNKILKKNNNLKTGAKY